MEALFGIAFTAAKYYLGNTESKNTEIVEIDNIPELHEEMLTEIIYACEPEYVLKFVCTCKKLARLFRSISKSYHDKHIHVLYSEIDDRRLEVEIYKDMFHGYHKIYENDKLIEHGIYKKDKLHGEVINYTSNGSIRSKYNYKRGKLHGTQYTYDEYNIIEEKNFKDGVRHGKDLKYHLNGELWVSCYYDQGSRHGTYKEYDESGKLIISRDYDHGNY